MISNTTVTDVDGPTIRQAAGSNQATGPHTASHPSADETRADERLLSLVHNALHGSGYEQLRRVKVYCHHGRITMQGRVATYYLKQVAQEALRTVARLQDIDNDLEVISK